MPQESLIFRLHAVHRMFERGISEIDVREVLENGEVIERDLEALPYPTILMLGCIEGRSIHVLAADNSEERQLIVITVYEPDPSLWESGFRKRRQ